MNERRKRGNRWNVSRGGCLSNFLSARCGKCLFYLNFFLANLILY